MRHVIGVAALAVAVVACTGGEASAFGRRGGRGGANCCNPVAAYYPPPCYYYPPPCYCPPYVPSMPGPGGADADPDPKDPPPPPPSAGK